MYLIFQAPSICNQLSLTPTSTAFPQLLLLTIAHFFKHQPTLITMAGPGPARVPGFYRYTATALGASMWFFLMYRARKDGAVLMGWKHPWDH
ncbi:hypothetical protein F5Y14DRAFT_404074 [Nemania sp. NC0429]|nr:hypothetical protein F5Y14DRAFT_404074 [Nemania sp. NC0429]